MSNESTMSPAEILASFAGLEYIVGRHDREGSTLEELKDLRTAVAALIERNAELEAKVNEYRLEYDNPAKDYVRRSMLRDQLFALARAEARKPEGGAA